MPSKLSAFSIIVEDIINMVKLLQYLWLTKIVFNSLLKGKLFYPNPYHPWLGSSLQQFHTTCGIDPKSVSSLLVFPNELAGKLKSIPDKSSLHYNHDNTETYQ